MLQELSIKDFAIISQLNISFEEGMTVLTGETGAGKSIVIDAVGLLVGGRGSSDFIRQGASKCSLQGLFIIDNQHPALKILENHGIECTDNMVIMQRDIFSNGKNVCRINSQLVNTTVLRKIGSLLVDIHGQHEHQTLMQSEYHLSMLDDFGDQELLEIKGRYELVYQDYTELLNKVNRHRQNEQEFAQRVDMLKFQVEEISQADLSENEEKHLLEERERLSNFKKIGESLNTSYEAISSETHGAISALGIALNAIEEIEVYGEDYKQIAELIRTSYYSLQEASSDLSRESDLLEMDESRLDFVEQRLQTIRSLERKYGEDVAAILTYFKQITSELDEAENFGTNIEEQEQLLEKNFLELNNLAKQLTEKRKQIAKKMTKEIHLHLRELYMDKTIFEVRFSELQFPKVTGKDSVEFFISTNPGEPLKPLVKVISGGELSRIMLALKTIFSKAQGITSIVFDEVDTGVSGRVAQAIADKIYQIAIESQVLCISHLPQVAAIADQQLYIEKRVIAERTEMNLKILNNTERIYEVARMIASETITPLALEHAKEMLDAAQVKHRQFKLTE